MFKVQAQSGVNYRQSINKVASKTWKSGKDYTGQLAKKADVGIECIPDVMMSRSHTDDRNYENTKTMTLRSFHGQQRVREKANEHTGCSGDVRKDQASRADRSG